VSREVRTATPARRHTALAIGAALALAITGDGRLSAHRLDEYLHAARIDLQPDGIVIEMDLTPGAAVADSVIATIDADRDGDVSDAEQRAYAEQVVRALRITVDDGQPLALRVMAVRFPPVESFRRGEGTIELHAAAAHGDLATGAHQLYFRNEHTGSQSVYLANALIPRSSRVAVTAQRRDGRQQELTIDYAVSPRSGAVTAARLIALASAAALLLFALKTAARPLQ
jgi:hypothetical protein